MKKGKCWAAPVGGCSQKMTKEHIFTESLFKGRVTVTSSKIRKDESTPPWLETTPVEISIRKLTANILCENHNRLLGQGPDRTAKKLMNALLRIKQPMKHRGSKIMRPPVPVKISGVSLGQWLCKIHCNILTATKFVPENDFVFYAFGKPTQQKLFFYTPAEPGYNLPIQKGHVTYVQYIDKKDPERNIFEVALSGLRILVSTTPVEKLMIADQPMAKIKWFDRVKCIQQPSQLGMFKITFDWSGEPPYSSDTKAGILA